MLPLRARAKRHDDEVGSSANANPQPPQTQFPLPQMEVPSCPLRPPQAKPIDPRRILPHPNTSHLLVSPATQALAGYIQNASSTLPEPTKIYIGKVDVTSIPHLLLLSRVFCHRRARTLLCGSWMHSEMRSTGNDAEATEELMRAHLISGC